MCQREDSVLVCVYSDKKLIRKETFADLKSAHRLIGKETSIGHWCSMQRMENGRTWFLGHFYPSESI